MRNASAELICVRGRRSHEISSDASTKLPESDIDNDTMNHVSAVLAAPALAFTATSGSRRVLWAANWRCLELDICA